MSSFLVIVLTGKARDVLVITNCIFGVICQIREVTCPRANIKDDHFNSYVWLSHGNIFGLFVCDESVNIS